MAGHSKWANIQHRKNAQDAKRGKLFTKLIRAITVSAKLGGPESDNNPRLRDAIDKALAANMARDTIDRAVKRGAGDADSAQMDEIVYEGYGIKGVAVLVECLTDNRNRTVAEVRHVFSKSGGNLGTDGSVSYLFNKQGILQLVAGADEDQVMEIALNAGADDVTTEADGSLEVITPSNCYHATKQALLAAGLTLQHAELTQIATTKVELDFAAAQSLLGMVDRFDELDDVQNVYTNADISDEVLNQL